MRIAILFVLAAASAAPGAGRAQNAGAAGCATIESDGERLACYDRALRPAPSTPAATPETPVAAPVAAAAATGGAAGTSKPPPAVEPSANPPAESGPIVVVGTRSLPGRGVEFTTERGDVWVQADTRSLQLPATPFNAQIKPGTFGSVFLIPENRNGIRVHRRN